MAERRGAGRVETAVRRDIKGLGTAAAESALAELALVLARAIDARGEDGPATTVKLVSELRVTLGQLREVSARAGDSGEDPGELSTPVWADGAAVRDAAVAGAADVGAEGRGDRPPVG